MKIIGNPIFAKNGEGKLISRIGTVFLKTTGLVTTSAVHAVQRYTWIESLNEERKAAGLPELTEEEKAAEIENSVDLVLTEEEVLIRPDPERMDLAMKADEMLQTLVSKDKIKFLNTSIAKVRQTLRERGEKWRIARQPISNEEMNALIEASRLPIGEHPIYYYNRITGTRYLTPASYPEIIAKLDPISFRRQLMEIQAGLKKRNRTGAPEIELFPSFTPVEIKQRVRDADLVNMSDEELRAAADKINQDWRMSIPTALRDESYTNLDWRNTILWTITRKADETTDSEFEIVDGDFAPEFYRQIEWLPGLRIVNGEVIFDPLLNDKRAKALLFNTVRLFTNLEWVNIGRIKRTLSKAGIEGTRRGYVYVLQFKEKGKPKHEIMMVRLVKWGMAERLDEGKDLKTAAKETAEYADYILDRRLMCRQLGMKLPSRVALGSFNETYEGPGEFNGMLIRTAYSVRAYITGTASDKIPESRYRNPAFAKKFAELMGGAAAVDMIVGRRSSVTKENLFDHYHEVIVIGQDGLPKDLIVTSHAGSFVNYEHELADYVASYAVCVRKRKDLVSDYEVFKETYLKAFEAKLVEVQASYREHRHAYDSLFADRPYNVDGSGAFRWAKTLKRLDACDPTQITALLKKAIEC